MIRKHDMTPSRLISTVAILGLMSVAAPVSAADAGDAAAGARKNSMCIGCHGIPDYHTAFPEVYRVPKLGGQHAAYIVKALQEYKAGNRSHPSMRAIAAGLSDRDMADLAAYYSGEAAKTAAK
jgi:cytochrome c553